MTKLLLLLPITGLGLVLLMGIEKPPKMVSASDLPHFEKISINNGDTFLLTSKEIAYWKSLDFELTTEDYPGETPDYTLELLGADRQFTAIYNKNSSIVFFSFIPVYQYGFLNVPPPGGWTKPLYSTKANGQLLELLKIAH